MVRFLQSTLALFAVLATTAVATTVAQAWTPPTGTPHTELPYEGEGDITYTVAETHVFGFEVGGLEGDDIDCESNAGGDFYDDQWTPLNDIDFYALAAGGECESLGCTVSAIEQSKPWTAQGDGGSETITFDHGPYIAFEFVDDLQPPTCVGDDIQFSVEPDEEAPCNADYDGTTGVMNFDDMAGGDCLIINSSNDARAPEGTRVSIASDVTFSDLLEVYDPPDYD